MIFFQYYFYHDYHHYYSHHYHYYTHDIKLFHLFFSGGLLNLTALKDRSLLMINETFNEGNNRNGNDDDDNESHGASDDDDNNEDNDENDNNIHQVKTNNDNSNENSPVAIIIATVSELYSYTEEHVSSEDHKRIVINFLKKIIKRYEITSNEDGLFCNK